MRDSWKNVPLSELLVQVKEPVKVEHGLAYKLLGVRWYGNGPFVRETVTSETSKATRLFPVQPGDFIYNRLFAWKGSFGLISPDLGGCFVSSEFPLFRVRQDRLDAVFLNLFMCQPSKWAQIEVESTGSTSVSRNRWKEERFLEQVLLLPPLDEQKRIVDVVSSVDGYIDSLQQQADSARTARSAVLHELLSAGGDDWTETTLGDVVDVQKGKKPPAIVGWEESCSPYLTADVLRGSDCEQFISQALTGSCVQLGGHEVVLLWDGAGAGDVFKSLPGILASTMAKIEVKNRSSIDNRYLYLFLDSRRMEIKSSCRGTTVPHVSPEALKGLKFALPPLEEQKQIVDVVSSMDDVIQATENAIADAKNLRSGILSDLLSGEHEIPVSYDKFLGAA
jgi:type I restriction enzyme S subunit